MKICGINKRAGEYYGKQHRIIWQRYNGLIPAGYMIHHINGKKRDNRIENLELISRKEHGLRTRKPNRIRIVYYTGSIKVKKIDELPPNSSKI